MIIVDAVQTTTNTIYDLKSDDMELDENDIDWKDFLRVNTEQNIITHGTQRQIQFKACNMDPKIRTPLECVLNA